MKGHVTVGAQLHELVHAQEQLVGRVDACPLFALQVWQTPDILGICAAKRSRASVVAAGRAEGSAWETEPDAATHRVRDQRSEFVQNVRVQEVSFATLLCEIKFECIKAMLTDSRSHSAGSAKSLNEKWSRYQVKVSCFGPGVSTL